MIFRLEYVVEQAAENHPFLLPFSEWLTPLKVKLHWCISGQSIKEAYPGEAVKTKRTITAGA